MLAKNGPHSALLCRFLIDARKLMQHINTPMPQHIVEMVCGLRVAVVTFWVKISCGIDHRILWVHGGLDRWLLYG